MNLLPGIIVKIARNTRSELAGASTGTASTSFLWPFSIFLFVSPSLRLSRAHLSVLLDRFFGKEKKRQRRRKKRPPLFTRHCSK